ncbi:hypothetical protein V6N13_133363 [Hibiscus sabdariffa]
MGFDEQSINFFPLVIHDDSHLVKSHVQAFNEVTSDVVSLYITDEIEATVNHVEHVAFNSIEEFNDQEFPYLHGSVKKKRGRGRPSKNAE